MPTALRVALLLLDACVLSLTGCGGKVTQAGGLELILETDMPTPDSFDTLNVELQQQTATGWSTFHHRDYLIPSEIKLPSTMALVAGSSPYQEVLITVTGILGTQPIVQRVVQTQVPTDRVSEVLIVLSHVCVGQVTCPKAGDSCQPDMGACGPGMQPMLLPYSPADLADAGVPSAEAGGMSTGATTGPGAEGGSPDATLGDAGGGGTPGDDASDSTVPSNEGGGIVVDGAVADSPPVEAGICLSGAKRCSGQQPQSCTLGQWHNAAACTGQACVGGMCQGVCSPGATQCSGNGVQTCDPTGAWGAAVACPMATPFCNGAGVCGACSDTTTQCSTSGGVQTCMNGAWGASMPCMNQACSMGMCTGTCLPGAKQCSGNGVQTCDTTGHWGMPAACVNQACVGNACQGVCTPGDARCSTNIPQKCDTAGAWTGTTACGTHQTCAVAGGAASCGCNTDPNCLGAGTTCANASTVAACGQDAQGCWYTASTSTCSNGACFGSGGSAQCCTNACTNASTRCSGASVQTCQVQGNGCTAWNAGTACGQHQSCVGSGQCVCNTDPTCMTTVGNVCTAAASYATCAKDAQNCVYQSGAGACGTNQSCTAGSCGCISGTMSCSAGCVNLSSDPSNCGTCNHVCPALGSPSSSNCGGAGAGKCTGNLGGAVQTGGAPIALDTTCSYVYAVQAVMPNTAGTFVGVHAMIGSTDTTAGSTTTVVLVLFSDAGGVPGQPLFEANWTDASQTFNNPSAPILIQSEIAGGTYVNGFTGALTAGATYWAYLKAGTNCPTAATAAPSSAPCVSGSWINDAPPGLWSYTTAAACPGNIDAYVVATFP
jgi:hypothetical protein